MVAGTEVWSALPFPPVFSLVCAVFWCLLGLCALVLRLLSVPLVCFGNLFVAVCVVLFIFLYIGVPAFLVRFPVAAGVRLVSSACIG